jgi:hypothetical protein
MNWAWWDGKMPVENYRHEHALDKDSIDAKESIVAKESTDDKAPSNDPIDKSGNREGKR